MRVIKKYLKKDLYFQKKGKKIIDDYDINRMV